MKEIFHAYKCMELGLTLFRKLLFEIIFTRLAIFCFDLVHTRVPILGHGVYSIWYHVCHKNISVDCFFMYIHAPFVFGSSCRQV